MTAVILAAGYHAFTHRSTAQCFIVLGHKSVFTVQVRMPPNCSLRPNHQACTCFFPFTIAICMPGDAYF